MKGKLMDRKSRKRTVLTAEVIPRVPAFRTWACWGFSLPFGS